MKKQRLLFAIAFLFSTVLIQAHESREPQKIETPSTSIPALGMYVYSYLFAAMLGTVSIKISVQKLQKMQFDRDLFESVTGSALSVWWLDRGVKRHLLTEGQLSPLEQGIKGVRAKLSDVGKTQIRLPGFFHANSAMNKLATQPQTAEHESCTQSRQAISEHDA